MTIVGYGYGLAGIAVVSNLFVDDIQIALEAQPDITVDDDTQIMLDDAAIDITVELDIEIEVD